MSLYFTVHVTFDTTYQLGSKDTSIFAMEGIGMGTHSVLYWIDHSPLSCGFVGDSFLRQNDYGCC
jgi:hypothetical protein